MNYGLHALILKMKGWSSKDNVHIIVPSLSYSFQVSFYLLNHDSVPSSSTLHENYMLTFPGWFLTIQKYPWFLVSAINALHV